MNPLILTGFLAFFVVALVVGVRLLLLWWRTRELPELLMGIGVLGIGPVGFGLMMVGVGTMASNPALGNTAFAAGTLASALGVVAKAIFNWRVYRKRSPFAIGAALAITGALVFVLVLHVMDGRWAPTQAIAWDGLLRSTAQVGCLLWGATESLLYWRKMQKRQRLGLADAVVVNRFLMWGIGAGFAGIGTGFGVVAEVLTGTPTLQIPFVVSTCSAMGFVSAVAIYLAFVPPRRYVRYIRAHA
jgi:hypothetical protein